MEKRSTNFTSTEENTLLSVVTAYKDIVECKQTDSLKNAQKNTIWVTIAKEYNSCAIQKRSVDALRTKYKNIKKKSKKKFADEKCHVKGTGGGPAKSTPLDATDVQVLDLLGQRMTGRGSMFDDDVEDKVDTTQPGQPVEEHFMAEMENQLVFDDDVGPPREEHLMAEMENQLPNCSNVLNWTSHTSQQLKTPISTPLLSTIPKRSKLNNAVNSWVHSKIESADVDTKLKVEKHQQQMLFMQEEHDLKITCMKEKIARVKEEHTLKITHMQEQQDQNARIMEEHHVIKMAILQQELLNIKK